MAVFIFVLMFCGMAVVISLLMAWPTMWLWNYCIVEAITVARPINYWVAFWIFFTLSICNYKPTDKDSK